MSMFRRSSLAMLFAGCLLMVGAGEARAASITWGAATNISGDSDVSKVGLLIGAFNVGASGVPSTTVNGVTFAPLADTAGSTTIGNFTFAHPGATFSSNVQFGSASAPFTSLSADYQSLLRSGSVGSGSLITITMTGLSVGQTYAFEWWSNDSTLTPFPRYTTNATSGNTVGLDDNTTGVGGGLGRFAIGTFVADGSPQVITFSGVSVAANFGGAGSAGGVDGVGCAGGFGWFEGDGAEEAEPIGVRRARRFCGFCRGDGRGDGVSGVRGEGRGATKATAHYLSFARSFA